MARIPLLLSALAAVVLDGAMSDQGETEAQAREPTSPIGRRHREDGRPRATVPDRSTMVLQGHFTASAKQLRAEHRRPHAERRPHEQHRPQRRNSRPLRAVGRCDR